VEFDGWTMFCVLQNSNLRLQMNAASLCMKDVSTCGTYKKFILSNFSLIMLSKLLTAVPEKKKKKLVGAQWIRIKQLSMNSSRQVFPNSKSKYDKGICTIWTLYTICERNANIIGSSLQQFYNNSFWICPTSNILHIISLQWLVTSKAMLIIFDYILSW